MALTKVKINLGTEGNLSGSRSIIQSTKTLVSSSAQIASNISGSITSVSSSTATRVAANLASINTLNGSGTAQGVGTSDSPTFNDVTVTGTLTAQEVHTEFESASILFTSGSTQFGNSSDDVHEFKGNTISGSATSTGSFGSAHFRGVGGVGIGTNNPDSQLHVVSAGSPSIRVTDTTNTVTGKFQADNSVGKIGTHTNHSFELFTNNTTALTINNSQNAELAGDLLITDNSDTPLTFKKTSNGEMFIRFLDQDSTLKGALIYRTDSNFFSLRTDGTTALTIDDSQETTFAGAVSASGNISLIKSNAILNIEEGGGSKAYLFSGGSFTALRTTSNTPLQFGANYSSADTMFIVGDKVGIATDSPTSQLTIASSTSPTLTFKDTGGGAGSKIFRLAGGGDKFFFEGRNDADSDDGDAGVLTTFDLTNGNVGIGTGTPLETLHVEHTTDDTDENGDIGLTVGGGASGNVRHYFGINNSGNYAYYGAVEHGTQYVPLILQPNGSNVGIGTTAPSIKFEVDAGSSSDIAKFHNDSNSTGITIGYTTNLGSIDLASSQALRIRQGGSTPFLLNTNGVMDGDFNDTSDITLKKDIQDLTPTIDGVKALKPSTFKWKDELRGDETKIGFIAQDVEEQFPELIDGDDGRKSINTIGLVSVLTKTIQGLIKRIEALESN